MNLSLHRCRGQAPVTWFLDPFHLPYWTWTVAGLIPSATARRTISARWALWSASGIAAATSSAISQTRPVAVPGLGRALGVGVAPSALATGALRGVGAGVSGVGRLGSRTSPGGVGRGSSLRPRTLQDWSRAL